MAEPNPRWVITPPPEAAAPSGKWDIEALITGKPKSALDALYGEGYSGARRGLEKEIGAEYGFRNETIGPVTDEIAGYLPAGIDWLYGQITGNPQPFSALLDERMGHEQQRRDEYLQEHPYLGIVANILGGAAIGPAGVGTSGGGGAGKVAAENLGGFWSKLFTGVKAGGAGGAVGGFAEGRGGLANRLEAAGYGLFFGAAAGGTLSAAAMGVSRLARGVVYIRNLKGKGAEQRAKELVLEAMRQDGISPDDLVARLTGDKPMTLADLGPNMRALIGSAGRQGGEARKTIEEFFEERTKGQFKRLVGDLSRDMGEDPATFGATERALVEERALASPLYEQLKGTTTPVDGKLQKLLQRPAGRTAIGRAINTIKNKGGFIGKSGELSFEVLDQAKKELDAMIRWGKTPEGGAKIGDVNALKALQRELLAELDTRFSGYAEARFASADPAKSLDALEAGRQFLRSESEDLAADFADMTPIEKDLFRLGAARELRAKMGAKGDGADVAGMFQNENMRERLKEVFPDIDSFKRFMQATVDERTMQETRNALLKGSPTASRMADDDAFTQGALGDAAVDIVRGRGAFDTALSAAMRAGRTANERYFKGVTEEVANEIGRLGTDTNIPGVAGRVVTPPAVRPNTSVAPVGTFQPGPGSAAPAGTLAPGVGVGSTIGRDGQPKQPGRWRIEQQPNVQEQPAAPEIGPQGAAGSAGTIATAGAQDLPQVTKAALRVAEGGRSITPVMLARTFVGKTEGKDAAVIATFIRKMTGKNIDPQQTPWCAAFANAILKAAGHEGTGKLNARSFLEFGTATDKPQIGDVAVFWRDRPDGWKGHVGFYAGTVKKGGKEYIRVIGGNQDDAVTEKLYPAERLLGYRRPPDLNAMRAA